MPVELALPKGRVLDETHRVLNALGFHEIHERRYRYQLPGDELIVRLMKLQDIPPLVSDGTFDLGVTADEWIAETESDVVRVAELDWYSARISLIGTATADSTNSTLRIVTEYPKLTRQLLADRREDLHIQAVQGSAEAFLPEHADYIVDCVETGNTLRANELVEIQRLMDCRVHLIARPSTWAASHSSPALQKVVRAVTACAQIQPQ